MVKTAAMWPDASNEFREEILPATDRRPRLMRLPGRFDGDMDHWSLRNERREPVRCLSHVSSVHPATPPGFVPLGGRGLVVVSENSSSGEGRTIVPKYSKLFLAGYFEFVRNT